MILFDHQGELQTFQTNIAVMSLFGYLDAVLIEEPWQREALLLLERLAEDEQLLKEEDSPLLHAAVKPALWVGHHERVLQQKAALSHDLPLDRPSRGTSFVGRK